MLIINFVNDAGLYVTLLYAVSPCVIIISDCCVSSGWTGLIRSLIPSSSSYRYSTTLGSTAVPPQPTRMDYGKEKYGGPFTEEEVEDVKTVLRLVPLIIMLQSQCSVVLFIIILSGFGVYGVQWNPARRALCRIRWLCCSLSFSGNTLACLVEVDPGVPQASGCRAVLF